MAKNLIYAVKQGRQQGLFDSWDKCKESIMGYKGAEYRGFSTIEHACEYLHIPVPAKYRTQATDNSDTDSTDFPPWVDKRTQATDTPDIDPIELPSWIDKPLDDSNIEESNSTSPNNTLSYAKLYVKTEIRDGFLSYIWVLYDADGTSIHSSTYSSMLTRHIMGPLKHLFDSIADYITMAWIMYGGTIATTEIIGTDKPIHLYIDWHDNNPDDVIRTYCNRRVSDLGMILEDFYTPDCRKSIDNALAFVPLENVLKSILDNVVVGSPTMTLA